MPKKKDKNSWMDDGDSAHWIAAKQKRKRVSPTDSKSSAKFSGEKKTTRKKIPTKK